MKPISKITVKHFINDSLHWSGGVLGGYNAFGKFDKDLKAYPIYVKITFLRKTTQIKSLINGDFYTIDKVKKEHSDQMEAEARMIEDVITKEYSLQGDLFSLKGISDKCSPYKGNFYDAFIESYLWKEFSNAILKTRSPFMRLLLQRFPNVPAIIHYDAATKLLGDIPAFEKLKSKFATFKDIETIFSKNGYLQGIQVFEWKFGKAKDLFGSYALKKGFSFRNVSEMVDIIDKQIENWK
jgi:hypothetical protein